MTLRTRLLLVSLICLLGLLAAVIAAEYTVLRSFLNQNTAEILRQELRSDLFSTPGNTTPTPAQLRVVANKIAGNNIGSAILDTTGANVLAASPAGGNPSISVPPDAIGRAQGAPTYWTYVTYNVGDIHLLQFTARLGGRGNLIAVLVTSLAADDSTLTTVVLITLLTGIAATLITLLAARPLIRRALRPLSAMTTAATAISEGDTTEPPSPNTRDEVGVLARALTTMVSKLRQSVGEKESQRAAMERFLADASHELRTPVAAIHSNAQVLLDGAHEDLPSRMNCLHNIETETRRMQRLVDDLLLLSKLEATTAPAPPVTDLNALFTGEVGRWQLLAGEHKLRVDVPEDVSAHADEHDVLHIVNNLIDNAARYTPNDAPIEVTVARTDTEIAISVSDYGPGIAPEDHERIFDRFYRGQRSSRSRQDGGSGLGLAIVRALAQRNGGTATVQAAPSGGASFVIRLPVSS